MPIYSSGSFSNMNDHNMAPVLSNGVGLTNDLLVEILTKLPLKCIFRCKCVSASWRLLLSDHYVTTRHPLIVSGVFYGCGSSVYAGLKMEPKYGIISDGSFCEIDLSYLPFHKNSSIIDCSNGLLLFYSSFPSAFHVCNPTTRKWAALPKPKNKSQLSILAFDAYKSPYYKVVCFNGWWAQGGQLEVFSSESGRWTEHNLNWGLNTDELSAVMHYFDGFLHLLAHPRHVVSIDLDKMSCVMELPELIRHGACLGNSSGFLHCTLNDADEFRIWVLKGSKWMLKCRFDVANTLKWGGEGRGMVSSDFLHHRQLNILAFHPKQEVIYICIMGNLVTYDLCKKRFGLICDMRSEKEKIQLNKIWLFPFSKNILECLA